MVTESSSTCPISIYLSTRHSFPVATATLLSASMSTFSAYFLCFFIRRFQFCWSTMLRTFCGCGDIFLCALRSTSSAFLRSPCIHYHHWLWQHCRWALPGIQFGNSPVLLPIHRRRLHLLEHIHIHWLRRHRFCALRGVQFLHYHSCLFLHIYAASTLELHADYVLCVSRSTFSASSSLLHRSAEHGHDGFLHAHLLHGLHAGQASLLPPHSRRPQLLEHYVSYVLWLRRYHLCALRSAILIAASPSTSTPPLSGTPRPYVHWLRRHFLGALRGVHFWHLSLLLPLHLRRVHVTQAPSRRCPGT